MTGSAARPKIAFYAPMKPPTHPNPSGDRRIAQLTLSALERAGFAPFLVSELRTLDMTGAAAAQAALLAEADLEAERILEDLAADPPALWFTYHCYYKAPDLIGPRVARALDIPYAISEPSHAPRRAHGRWAAFAAASERALLAADLLFWTTGRDWPGLRGLTGDAPLVHLPAFVDPGPPPQRPPHHPLRDPDGPLRLLAIAMMRRGDKLASYQALADALAELEDLEWRLAVIGDGPCRAAVELLFNDFRGRVEFSGRVDDPALLRAACEASELLVWPGIGEGVGMLYLEAQAAGLPCLAERRPGPADVIHAMDPAPRNDAAAFAAAIRAAAADRAALAAAGAAARDQIIARHSVAAAARILRDAISPLLAARAGRA